MRNIPKIKVHFEGKVIEVDLEDYVASVLSGEVPGSWPSEALKAQAIAARTYAVAKMRERRAKNFHVQSTVTDQVYKINPGPVFVAAAKATYGLVLTKDKKLVETSFHSTCGGKTADSQTVWGRSYEHLRGVICNYCKASKTYFWRESVSLLELEAKFKQKINGINILNRSEDGRVINLELCGEHKKRLSGNDFRMTMGWTKVRSTLIDSIEFSDNHVEIKGRGFGHGVGLCQHGAMGMAQGGKRFQEILYHYYPNTILASMY